MDIEQIKADRGKESFERWYATQPNFANGWWVVASDEDGDNYVDESGDGGFEEVTARRIARVPDLEAAVIAQEALIKELVKVVTAFINQEVDYMDTNNLGDPEQQHNVKWGRAVIGKAAQ